VPGRRAYDPGATGVVVTLRRTAATATRRDPSEVIAPAVSAMGRTFAAAATVGAIALAIASTAASGATLRKCGSVTIPVKITRSIPLKATDIAVSLVTCSYAEKVFLPAISAPGAGPPKGWSITNTHLFKRTYQETCNHGKDVIVFRYVLPS
jgi:hypothetical protein